MEPTMKYSGNSEQQTHNPELADNKETITLYNPNTAGILSAFLSPVFGAIIIRSNWKIMGNEGAAKRALYWAIGLVVAFLIIVLFVPQKAAGSAGVIVLIVWYLLECRSCQKYIQEHHLNYQKKSWKRPLLIGVPICILSLLILTSLSSDSISEQELAESAKPLVTNILYSNGVYKTCKEVIKIKSLGDGKYSAKALCENDIVLNIEIEELDDNRITVRILE